MSKIPIRFKNSVLQAPLWPQEGRFWLPAMVTLERSYVGVAGIVER